MDHAALITYRLLEISVQYLLYTYGSQPSKASYDHLEMGKQELLDRINEQGAKIYCASTFLPYTTLPKRITIMLGILIFNAMDDPIVKRLNLIKLKGRSEVRNRSILAHVFQTISFDELNPF